MVRPITDTRYFASRDAVVVLPFYWIQLSNRSACSPTTCFFIISSLPTHWPRYVCCEMKRRRSRDLDCRTSMFSSRDAHHRYHPVQALCCFLCQSAVWLYAATADGTLRYGELFQVRITEYIGTSFCGGIF